MEFKKMWHYFVITPWLYLLIEFLIVELTWGVQQALTNLQAYTGLIVIPVLLVFFGVVPMGCSIIAAYILDYFNEEDVNCVTNEVEE